MKPSERAKDLLDGNAGDTFSIAAVIFAFFGYVGLAFWLGDTFGLLAAVAVLFAPGALLTLGVMGAADGRQE